MSMQRQEQAQARKRFRWTRLIIAIAAFLLLAAVTLIWILSYGHVISSDLASILTIVFTVLAIAVPFYLWLFPIATDKPNPPVVAPSQPTPQPSSPGPLPEKPELPETPPTATWNVPSRRNPFFTGREDILKRLRDALTTGKATALTQPQAISGLGGIGKTQTAVEYAYRYRDDYQYILWASADTREALISGFVIIAGLLNLPEKDAQDQSLAVNAVKRWLQTHTGWLLILDNADDLAMACDFLPPAGKGHTLLTTRAQAMGTLAQSVEIEKMEPQEGASFLLHRARIIAQDAPLEAATAADRATARNIVEAMDGLPLALDQAGAYIEETRCSLSNYLALYQKQRTELLKRRGGLNPEHPVPVASTWSLSFQKVEQANPAADILRLCAFLSPDAIPEELITEGAPDLGPALQSVAADLMKANDAIGELLKYSLVRRNPDQMLTIHRLVQAVLKDEMSEETQLQWAEHAVRAVNRVFPEVEYTTWPQCQRLLPHARVCAALIEQWGMALPEAGRLLNQVGWYLRERALYAEAEPLLQRALAIHEQVLGLEHHDVVISLNNLALLYEAQGRYAQAEPLYQRALTIVKKTLGPEHPEIARTLNNLALLYHAQGKYAEAEPLYQQALAIWEKALGPEHPEVASGLNNLAELYRAQGKYVEAEPLYQRALAVWEKALGPEHPEVASGLNNLAFLYDAQGKYAEAEPLYQRALVIVEKALGQEHPAVATCLENYAALLRKTKRQAEAEKLEARARAIRAKHARENPAEGG